MNEKEFLEALRARLYSLPAEDMNRTIDYYTEMIEDRMEDGLTEEEAVAGLGNLDEITSQVLLQTPIHRLVQERVKNTRTLQTWEVLLLVLGSPIWISLLAAAFSIILSMYAVLWSLIISCYAVCFSFLISSVAVLVGFVVLLITGKVIQAFYMLGAALLLLGVGILVTRASCSITKCLLRGTKRLALWTRSKIIRKGDQNE